MQWGFWMSIRTKNNKQVNTISGWFDMFAVAFLSPSMFNLDPAAFLWLASFWCVGDLKEWSSLAWSLIRSDYISLLFDKDFTHSPLQLVRSFPWHFFFFFFFLAWGLVHDLKEIIHWRKILPLTLQASKQAVVNRLLFEKYLPCHVLNTWGLQLTCEEITASLPSKALLVSEIGPTSNW